MWPVLKLSNGTVLDNQQRIKVRVLRDMVSDPALSRKTTTVAKGSKMEIRHWPPNRLTLVKPTSGNTRFKDIKLDPVEGVDYVLIAGEIPFPPKQTYSILF